jgi:acetyl-CoA C-acetyltransferase
MPTFSEADPIVVLSYARTPMGGMQGALADVSRPSSARPR